MKAPKVIKFGFPKAPVSGNVKRAFAYVGSFAHHPPSLEKTPARMGRPKGGHGPHNQGEG